MNLHTLGDFWLNQSGFISLIELNFICVNEIK